MHMRLIAVGDRQPAWVDAAFSEYAARLPRAWQFSLHAVPTSPRRKHGSTFRAKQAEGDRILGELRPAEYGVMLDETGRQLSTGELADELVRWQRDARDVCFVIGGPDGLDSRCLERADFCWSLSRLTLPHGLARVVFVEQLYRANSLQEGHPYHRS